MVRISTSQAATKAASSRSNHNKKKKIIVPALMPQAYIISKSCSSPVIEGQYDPDPVRDEETEAQRGEATAQRRTAGRRQSQILIPILQTFDLFREP